VKGRSPVVQGQNVHRIRNGVNVMTHPLTLWAAAFVCILGLILIPSHPVLGLLLAGGGFLVVSFDWRGR
jgi:hypothetical protein